MESVYLEFFTSSGEQMRFWNFWVKVYNIPYIVIDLKNWKFETAFLGNMLFKLVYMMNYSNLRLTLFDRSLY